MLLFYTTAAGQQLSPQTLNAAGKSSNAGGVLLEDAVGGFIVSIITTPTFMYTQGFIQPDAGTTTIIPPINDVVFSSGSGFDNAGTTFIAGGAMLEFTVGEFISITQNGGSNLLTQGILQPYKTGKFWTGAINTDWTNVNNWSPSFLPTDIDSAIIPPGCPNYPVITTGVIAVCKSINAQPGSSVTINTGGLLNIKN